MIEFRDLKYFCVACEHDSLGHAADILGIASSTLSTSLKSFEAALGAPLLRRLGSGIVPLPSARWVYRAAIPLLLLEKFAVESARARDGAEGVLLHLDIDLTFAFGAIATAINRAAARMKADGPVLVHPRWTLEDGAEILPVSPDTLGLAQVEHGRIFVDTAKNTAEGEVELLVDPWVLVRRNPAQPGTRSLRNRPVALPKLPHCLLSSAQTYLYEQGVTNIRILDEHPCALPELQHERPDLTFMVPSSVLAARMSSQSIEPVSPPHFSRIMGRAAPGDKAMNGFFEQLSQELNEPNPPFVFEPVLTGRRTHYFNLTHDLGRVSAAARSASIAQPALSQQLRKLEASLDATLFCRESAGLIVTDTGRKLARSAKVLERKLRELSLSGMSASLADGGQLSIGILPSVNQHGFLVNRVTDALLELRNQYPALNLLIQEAPKATLQDWISRGRLGIAIVETKLPQFPRFALNAAEDLAVIADPRFALLPPGPITLRDAARLPLALPTSQFGLRQILDAAAREKGISLKPKHQIDALAMLIGLIAREPICTILTASSVQVEVSKGELRAHPIIDPAVVRDLFLVYSGDRSLTPAERDLIALLRKNLSKSQKPQLELC